MSELIKKQSMNGLGVKVIRNAQGRDRPSENGVKKTKEFPANDEQFF